MIIGKTNYNLHLIEDDTFFDQETTKEIGYLLDKYGKNYKIASLEQFKKNKNAYKVTLDGNKINESPYKSMDLMI